MSCVDRAIHVRHVSNDVVKISRNKSLPAYLGESARDVLPGTHHSFCSTSSGRADREMTDHGVYVKPYDPL